MKNEVKDVRKKRAAAGKLPVPKVVDNTTTKTDKVGESNADKVAASVELETLKKREVFARAGWQLLPVQFDDTVVCSALAPLVESGVMSKEAAAAAVAKSRREFENQHADEIAAAENLNFAAVIAKLRANAGLFADLLEVCEVKDFEESRYVRDGRVIICHGEQNKDNSYVAQFAEIRGEKSVFYVEHADVTTSNILRAIRNFCYYIAAVKRAQRAADKRDAPLLLARKAIRAAIEKGFTLEQITNKL